MFLFSRLVTFWRETNVVFELEKRIRKFLYFNFNETTSQVKLEQNERRNKLILRLNSVSLWKSVSISCPLKETSLIV